MLKTRIITSVLLALGLLGTLFLAGNLLWALIMLVAVAVAAWEWGLLIGLEMAGRKTFVVLLCVVIIACLPSIWPSFIVTGQYALLFSVTLASTLFWLVLAPLFLLSAHQSSRGIKLLMGTVLLLAFWMAAVALRSISPTLILVLMATVWIADSAAYFAGSAYGRHKLAPSISPGKTWEGVLGAWLAVTLYGLLLCWAKSLSLWWVVGLWGITVLSIIGDLFESLLKRQSGLKDSGSILPGHGGILDRIDGLLPTLPVAAFAFHLPLYFNLFGLHYG
ncbi:MAG: phosphatidate cytidylyltransferase [Methylophilales bacterium]|nr:phosphatidate cytidylyltransferase [Methylophilales bacterium]